MCNIIASNGKKDHNTNLLTAFARQRISLGFCAQLLENKKNEQNLRRNEIKLELARIQIPVSGSIQLKWQVALVMHRKEEKGVTLDNLVGLWGEFRKVEKK